MSKFKVFDVDHKTTASGIELKKLILQGEGKQYPDKNVTMWSDHPLFSTIAAGQDIEAELEVKDSQTPNPKGSFYKNKTLLKPGQTPSQAAPPASTTDWGSRTHNTLELKVIPMLQMIMARLDRMEQFVTGEDELKPKDDFMMPDFGEEKKEPLNATDIGF